MQQPTIDHDNLKRGGLGYRYVLFEADGNAVGPGAIYSQRPAATRHAERHGCGLYDTREREVIRPVSVEQRLEKLRKQVEYRKDELAKAEAKLERCENVAKGVTV